MNWYLRALKNYFIFEGRACRSEYWYFYLYSSLPGLALYAGTNVSKYFWVFYILYVLAMFMPGLAVTVRRLHDVGKSGSWFFIAFVPLVGLIFLYFLVKSSEPHKNKYGPVPTNTDIDQFQQTTEDADSHWACPECAESNLNNSFKCSKCGYRIV